MRSPAARLGVVGAAVAGTAVLAVLLHRAEVGAGWLYPWGLLVAACCTAVVVAGALQPGPLAAALSFRPLVALGRISYGVYLLHWPIFLWLTPPGPALAGPSCSRSACR